MEEWQNWFLGSEKRLTPGVFKRDCLTVGAEELEKKIGVEIFLNTIKNGRNVVGYEIQIADNRPPTTADIYRQEMKEYQATLFDSDWHARELYPSPSQSGQG